MSLRWVRSPEAPKITRMQGSGPLIEPCYRLSTMQASGLCEAPLTYARKVVHMNPLHRIIDANANRAREALRVMEDAARFGLDDPHLTEDLKQLRHGLRASLGQRVLDPALLLSARDVEQDPGRTIKTGAELSRSGLRDIAAAACARLTEALR